jgi:hypothetical protein
MSKGALADNILMNQKGQSLNALKTMAQKIHFVSFDVVKFKDKELRSHWYKYESVDLYYFEKTDGSYAKIHVNIFGQFVEWNPFDGVRTGLLIEEEKNNEVYEVLQYDQRANEKSISQGLLVLENAFQIDQKHREQLIRCIQNQHPKSFWQKWLHQLRLFTKKRYSK